MKRTASTSSTPIRITRTPRASWRISRAQGSAAIARGSRSTRLPDGTGYIVVHRPVGRRQRAHIYPREGAPGNPHDHAREIAVVRGGADATDGMEISSARLGPGLPHGVMVAMNSASRNFLVFRWQDVAAAMEPPLRMTGRNLP